MDLIFLILLLKRLLQLYHRIFSNPSLNLLNYIPIILILKNYFYTLIKISNSLSDKGIFAIFKPNLN